MMIVVLACNIKISISIISEWTENFEAMFSPTVISSWTTDAHRTLTDARKQCADAHASLEWTSTSLGPGLVSAAHSARDSVARLSASWTHLDPIFKTCARAVQHVVDEMAAEPHPNISLLQSVVAILENTPDPDSQGTLADYVNSDDIRVLVTNAQAHAENGKKISSAIAGRLAVANRQWLTLSRHATRATALLRETLLLVEGLSSPGPHIETNANVRTLLRENDSLENELATVLHLLTKHYDQCVAASSLYAQDPRHQDLHVLARDAQELAIVRGELSALCDIIETNRVRATRLLEPRKPVLESIIRSAAEDMDQSRQLRIELLRLILLSSQVSTRHPKEVAQDYTDQVATLTTHYVQYHQAYCSHYLKELYRQEYEYPRQFWHRIDRFVHNELAQMFDQEYERRQRWIDKYGRYLPRQLELPGPDSQPRVTQVITEDLDVDGIEQKSEREDRILLLIRQMALKS